MMMNDEEGDRGEGLPVGKLSVFFFCRINLVIVNIKNIF